MTNMAKYTNLLKRTLDKPLPSGNLQTDAVRYRDGYRIVASNGNISTLAGYNFYVLPIPKGATKIYLVGHSNLKPSAAASFGFNNNAKANSGWVDRYSSGISQSSFIYNLNTNYTYVGFTIYGTQTIHYEFRK